MPIRTIDTMMRCCTVIMMHCGVLVDILEACNVVGEPELIYRYPFYLS